MLVHCKFMVVSCSCSQTSHPPLSSSSPTIPSFLWQVSSYEHPGPEQAQTPTPAATTTVAAAAPTPPSPAPRQQQPQQTPLQLRTGIPQPNPPPHTPARRHSPTPGSWVRSPRWTPPHCLRPSPLTHITRVSTAETQLACDPAW